MIAILASVALTAATSEAALQSVTYPSGTEKVTGLLAAPSAAPSGGRHPALILVHEWWGLNDFAKGKAQQFADQGYVTLAVDLYRGAVASDPDTAHQLSRGLPEDRAKRDLAAAFAYLASRPDVDPRRIASIGWCMGGGYALEEALQEPRLAAAVIFYGRLPTDPAVIAGIKAKLLGNFGMDDKGIPPEAVSAFEKQARADGVSVDFKEYPGAGHGFASSADPKIFRTKAATDADRRALSFLEATLGPRTPTLPSARVPADEFPLPPAASGGGGSPRR
jgi:carboxymethylenebutenolidase